MYKFYSTVKLAGISAFMTVVNFLILLHKALVAFYRVIKGEKVVPDDYVEDNTPQPPSPPPTPQPPSPDNVLPFPINIVWDTISEVISNHIFDNLFGHQARFRSNFYTRQWILDFIRNDEQLRVRIQEVLKDICKVEEVPPSDPTQPT